MVAKVADTVKGYAIIVVLLGCVECGAGNDEQVVSVDECGTVIEGLRACFALYNTSGWKPVETVQPVVKPEEAAVFAGAVEGFEVSLQAAIILGADREICGHPEEVGYRIPDNVYLVLRPRYRVVLFECEPQTVLFVCQFADGSNVGCYLSFDPYPGQNLEPLIDLNCVRLQEM